MAKRNSLQALLRQIDSTYSDGYAITKSSQLTAVCAVLARRRRAPLIISVLLAALALFLALAPAPFNLLPARLVFSVEDVSFDPITEEGGTYFRATIRYANFGPARANLAIVGAEAFSKVNGSFFLADDIHKFFSMGVGEERVLELERPTSVLWDSIAFFIRIKLDWVKDDLEGVLLPGQDLVLDI
jgi:hypothetical protein